MISEACLEGFAHLHVAAPLRNGERAIAEMVYNGCSGGIMGQDDVADVPLVVQSRNVHCRIAVPITDLDCLKNGIGKDGVTRSSASVHGSVVEGCHSIWVSFVQYLSWCIL